MKALWLCLLCLLSAIGAGAADAARPPSKTLGARQNEEAEWRGQARRACADPFNEVTLDALVTLADGSELRVPGLPEKARLKPNRGEEP